MTSDAKLFKVFYGLTQIQENPFKVIEIIGVLNQSSTVAPLPHRLSIQYLVNQYFSIICI